MGSSRSKHDVQKKTNKEPTVVRIALIGTFAVGKTSIVTRYVDGEFSPAYQYTRGGSRRVKSVTMDESHTRIQVIDTGGQHHQIKCIRPLYRFVDGIILVHDISKPESYHDVDDWLVEIQNIMNNKTPLKTVWPDCKHCKSKPLVMLVGNKSDLDSSITYIDLKGKPVKQDKACLQMDRITYEEIQQRVNEDDNLVNFYCEVSAKTGINIDSAFRIMATEIIYTQENRTASVR